MTSRNTLLYIALGEYYANQAVVSLASLLLVYGRARPEFGVVVITDMPEKFVDFSEVFSLEVRKMDFAEMIALRGSHGFVLRPKIALIERVHSELQGNLLFIDTDTIVRRKLDGMFRGIQEGFCYLHTKEWPLRSGRKSNPELCPRDLNFTLSSGTRIQINGETEMWNSGVVGIPATAGALLRDALELCDRYYEVFPGWHVEQFSLSIMLQATNKLRGCRREVFHYWHNKELAKNTILKHQNIFCNSSAGSVLDRIDEKKIYKFIFQARLKYYIHKIRVFMRKQSFFYKIYLLFKH
jgi:hypothetical protein